MVPLDIFREPSGDASSTGLYKAGTYIVVQRDVPTLQTQPTDPGHSTHPVDHRINAGGIGWEAVLPVSSGSRTVGRSQDGALSLPSRS